MQVGIACMVVLELGSGDMFTDSTLRYLKKSEGSLYRLKDRALQPHTEAHKKQQCILC